MSEYNIEDSDIEILCSVMDSVCEDNPKYITLDECHSPGNTETAADVKNNKRPSNADEKEPPPKMSKISTENIKLDVKNEESVESIEPLAHKIDIWDQNSKQLYGLKTHILESIGLRPPLTNWVHITNVKCERNILKEMLEMAGTVLYCNVVHTVTGYAKVMFSHPLEAVQAISLFDKQTFYGRVLSISMLRVPPDEALPKGLQKLGRGFGIGGKPLRDVTRQFERFINGKSSLAEGSIIQTESNIEENTDNGKDNTENTSVVSHEKSTITMRVITRNKYIQTDKEKPIVDERILKKIDQLRSKGVTVSTILTTLDDAFKSETKSDKRHGRSSSLDRVVRSRDSDTYPHGKKVDNYQKPSPKQVIRPFVQNTAPTPQFGNQYSDGLKNINQTFNQMPNNQVNSNNDMYGNSPAFNNNLTGPAFVPQTPFQGISQALNNANQNSNMMNAIQNVPFAQFQNVSQPNMSIIGAAMATTMNAMNAQNQGMVLVALSNLPPSISFQLLREKMCQCGEVKFIKTPSPGCALVGYAKRWEAERCISTYNKTVVDNHQIDVKFV